MTQEKNSKKMNLKMFALFAGAFSSPNPGNYCLIGVSRPRTIYRHATDCSKYFQCSYGETGVVVHDEMQCPDGLLFDKSLKLTKIL